MDHKENNIEDYIRWRGDLSFAQSPFNEIDGLIFSVFSYMDFSCVRPNNICFLKDAVKSIVASFEEKSTNGAAVILPDVENLAVKASSCARFSQIGVCNFVNILNDIQEIQFSAVTFLLPDQTLFISFRGTDNTLVGWKEDFNMSFTSDGVPAQLEAAKYTSDIAEAFPMPMRIGGHSKGGNLAVWAASHVSREIQDRILSIYSNDGPGFTEGLLESEPYLTIKDRISSFVPESSIVGVLMSHGDFTIIKSSNPSLMQHDPFSWLVERTHFIVDDSRSASSIHIEKIVNSWLETMSESEREDMIDTLYDIITSSNAKTLDDLDNSKLKSLISMQKTVKEMDPEKRAQLTRSLKKMFFKNDTDEKQGFLSRFTDPKNDDVN